MPRVGLIDVHVKQVLPGLLRLQWMEGQRLKEIHLNEREARDLHCYLGQQLFDMEVTRK